MIEFVQSRLDNCEPIAEVVVVIDVLRAFTTTAFAFDRGAAEFRLVSTVEETFRLGRESPDALLIGEVDGYPVNGFDLPNSPSRIAALDLGGRRLIMRTTAGTQGVVAAAAASHIFAASLSNASASARAIAALDPAVVQFIETGVKTKGGGEEDTACADFIIDKLRGREPDRAAIRARVTQSKAAARFVEPDNGDLPASDLHHALQIDCFDFAMKVDKTSRGLILKPCPVQPFD